MIERGVKEIGPVWNHGLHPNLMEFNQGKSKVCYFFKKNRRNKCTSQEPCLPRGWEELKL